jgi:tRNA-specific 2-thiouridylase
MARRRERIAIAMSGGVDSSTAAALLVRQGHEVIGLTMRTWREDGTDAPRAGCCSPSAVEDARRVARLLGIRHHVLNLQEAFHETVIRGFIDAYAAGRTPNPCVACNRYIKFDLMLRMARELGCDALATGHYARIRRHPSGRLAVMRAAAKEKDQSYALYAATQDQLAALRFPLGTVKDKGATRRLAAEAGLAVADRQESQDICFVVEAGGYRRFLRQHAPQAFEEGDIRDLSGRLVGRHGGIAEFTIGQRKGLGAATDGKPRFVISIDSRTNTVLVGGRGDLLSDSATVEDVVWGALAGLSAPMGVKAKIRYNMPACGATLFPPDAEARLRVRFTRPVSAVTPGQIAVFYRGESIVAGGTIVGP